MINDRAIVQRRETLVHRVLYDIHVTGPTPFEYAGIPHDARQICTALASANGIDVTLLLHPVFDTKRLFSRINEDPTVAASMLLNGYGVSYGDFAKDISSQIKRRSHRLRSYEVRDVSGLLLDSVWRTHFHQTLSPDERRSVLARTKLAISAVPEDDLLRWRRTPTINSRSFDFLIFPDVRVAKVSFGTAKIVRCHDALPLVSSDTFEKLDHGHKHLALLKQAALDSYFVFNSEPSREQVLTFIPELESKSSVIPCIVPEAPAGTDVPLVSIISSRMARLPDEQRTSRVEGHRRPIADDQEFILMVSTIEPRKNHVQAIRAFNKVRLALHRDIRLILVGAWGWKFGSVLRALEEGLGTGDIIHLMNLPHDELAHLYRKAAAVIMPSYAEGFSMTPLEAMAHGSPCVVSDIPAHRWVLGDAVLYADPYDPDALAEQLRRILDSKERPQILSDLRAKSSSVVCRYSPGRAAEKWLSLLDRIAGERAQLRN